jgi:hypothetical protein
MDAYGIPRARTEIRTCGWLAQVDEHRGSIFHWRPYSKGAADMALLIDEVLELLAKEDGSVAAFITTKAALPLSDEPVQTIPAPEGERGGVAPIINESQEHEAA